MNASRKHLLAILASSLMTFALPSAAAAFQEASVNTRLDSCDPAVVRAAADEVYRDPKSLKEPATLYQAAMSLALTGQSEQGALLYLTARLRMSRQAYVERGDRGQVLAVMEMVVSPLVMPTLWADPALARRLVQRVIEWDRATPDPILSSDAAKTPENKKKLAEVDAALARFPDQIRDDPNREVKLQAMVKEATHHINLIVPTRCAAEKRARAK
jgi:hypothetical protein